MAILIITLDIEAGDLFRPQVSVAPFKKACMTSYLIYTAELLPYLLISFIFKYISICLEYTHLGGELQKFMTLWMKKCILMSVLNNLSLFWRHWLRSDHSIKGKYPFNEYLAKPSAAFNDIMSFFLDNVGLICLFPPCVANISHCRNQTVALPLSCPSFFTSSY